MSQPTVYQFAGRTLRSLGSKNNATYRCIELYGVAQSVIHPLQTP